MNFCTVGRGVVSLTHLHYNTVVFLIVRERISHSLCKCFQPRQSVSPASPSFLRPRKNTAGLRDRPTLGAHVQIVTLVCLISPLENLFRPENTVTYSAATEVNIFVGFSLKSLRYRDPALPPYGRR